MQVDFSRDQAAELLLGRSTLSPDAFAATPPFLRRRAAHRAAVQVLAEASRLSAFELGALAHAATGDSDPHVRASAVQVLVQAAGPALAGPLLIACSADSDAQVRAAAQQALARLDRDGARVVPLRGVGSVDQPAAAPKLPAFIAH
jgi:hypothetical protein